MQQFYFCVVLGAFFVFSSGYAAYAMLVLLIAILAELMTRGFRWVPTRLDRPLLGLLIVSFASGIASPWRTQSLPLTMLFALMALVSVYPAARVIRTKPEAIRPIVGVWVAGALFAAAWAIIRTAALIPGGASTPALGRTALGTTLAAAIPLALGAWTIWDAAWVRIALAVGLPILMTALALTTSRASWIAAVVGAAVMIGFAPRRRAWIVGLCLAPIVFAILVVGAQRSYLTHRLESTLSVEANVDRLAIWSAVPKIVRDHPLLGTGYGTFILAWPQYQPGPDLAAKPTAHNVFLNFAAETGLLGLAAFVVLIGTGLAGLWNRLQSSRDDPRTDALWTALLAAVVAMLTQQLFDATVMSLHIGYGLLASLALGGTLIYRNTPA